MANTSKTTRPIESGRDSFDALQRRFLSLTSRLEALKDTLGNSENMPHGLGAAAFVFRETTDELVELQGDIESWHDDHEHTPKEVPIMSNQATISPDESEEAAAFEKLPKELDELYRDLDDWYRDFDHTRVVRAKIGP